MGLHGHHAIFIFQELNKRHYICELPLNFGCLFQTSKTLWNGKHKYSVSHGKARHFQDILGKVDKFGWWYLDQIQTDAGTHFTSNYFQEGLFVYGVRLTLEVLECQEINGHVEVIWNKLRTIAH